VTEDEIILTHILQCRPVDLAINDPVLTDFQQEQYENYRRRRQAGEPLQYILGTCNFMGLDLLVNPSVLIPRPETEQLVDQALKSFKGGYALDLGTGCGNIAISLAKKVAHSQIVSVDISIQALETAKANAMIHDVADRVHFVQADIEGFCKNSKLSTLFDLIISNPPYVPTGQISSLPRDVQQEPVSALDGGEDGLNFYRFIVKYTPRLLRRGACLMMEFGDGQVEAIKSLFEKYKKFSYIEIYQDLAGRDRIIKAVL
jgi:release factor glutamine methyltransferase